MTVVTSSPDFSMPITLTAYDASNNVLGKASVGNVLVGDWSANFLGLQSTTGIRKVRFNGHRMVMDGLRLD